MCYWRGVGRAGVSTEQGQWRSRGATALTRKEDVRCCAMWLMGAPTEWAVAVGWVGGGGSWARADTGGHTPAHCAAVAPVGMCKRRGL